MFSSHKILLALERFLNFLLCVLCKFALILIMRMVVKMKKGFKKVLLAVTLMSAMGLAGSSVRSFALDINMVKAMKAADGRCTQMTDGDYLSRMAIQTIKDDYTKDIIYGYADSTGEAQNGLYPVNKYNVEIVPDTDGKNGVGENGVLKVDRFGFKEGFLHYQLERADRIKVVFINNEDKNNPVKVLEKEAVKDNGVFKFSFDASEINFSTNYDVEIYTADGKACIAKYQIALPGVENVSGADLNALRQIKFNLGRGF